MPSQKIRLSLAQSYTLSSTSLTLSALSATVHKLSRTAPPTDLVLFPEAYLGGYPRGASFGAAVGARSDQGREQFLQYFKQAVDLGDTPLGAGDKWVRRELDGGQGNRDGHGVGGEGKRRGDGTREELERIARETGVFVVTGLVERAGGTLYCAVVYVCPKLGVIGKRRKVLPTGSERLIWGQGSPTTLRAVTTVIRGVPLTLAAAVCWENYMPLLRHALYAQNVNLYLAPTADARDTWLALMRTVACEGRCFVVSANLCVRKKDVPKWISGEKGKDAGSGESGTESMKEGLQGEAKDVEQAKGATIPIANGHRGVVAGRANEDDGAAVNEENKADEFACRGGSCIISPSGDVLAGPLWDDDNGVLSVDVDFEDCLRGRLDLDVAGSYSRNDAFKLTVEGLDLNPPL